MNTILIAGDSFGADWTVKYTNKMGWPNIMENSFDVTNVAQAGCSEYKILQQLQKVHFSDYGVVIVNHTSPYRLYVKDHPIHKDNVLHHSSDLLYGDLKYHFEQTQDQSIMPIVEYFENYFDIDYAKFVYNLIYREIHTLCEPNTIHLSHIGLSEIKKLECRDIHEIDMFKNNSGLMNHYSSDGNIEIARTITTMVNGLLK
jgi:hypothetical protein